LKTLLHPLILTLLLALSSPALALSEDDAPPPEDLPEAQDEEEGDASAQATDEAKARARNALRKRPSIAPAPGMGVPQIRTEGSPEDFEGTDTPAAVPPPLSGPRSNAVAQATTKTDGDEEEAGPNGLKDAGSRKVTKEYPSTATFHVDYDNVEIKQVITDFSERYGLNVLVDPKISGKVTIISPKPVTRDAAYKIFLAALDQQGYTTVVEGRDARGEAYLIRIIDSREAKSEPIGVYRSSTPNVATLITRIIQLENVSVDEISKVISKMISSAGDLTTYNPSNTLILTDSGNNIRRILDIIKELDISAPRQQLEVIQIQFAEAARVVEIVKEIYGEDGSGAAAASTPASTRASRRSNRNSKTKAAAPKTATSTSVGSEASFIGKMIADERTNAIIVLATEKSLVEIKALIKDIDYQTDPSADAGIHVLYLSHAKAEDLSATLNSLIQQSNQRTTQTTSRTRTPTNARADTAAGATGGAAGNLGGNFAGEVRITHDVPTNSLVVTAGQDDYYRLRRVIDALDIARKQVFVETVIMEVSDDDRKDSGVSWHAGKPGDQDSPAGVNVIAGRGTESLNLASALLDGSLLGGAGLGIFGNAIDLALPGVEGGISIPTFGIVLRALQNDNSTNVLSAPNILTLDNEEATIEVGETVPFPTGSILGGLGGAAAGLGAIPSVSFTREDVGIILRITPQVNESDWVTLDVYQEISEVKEGSGTASAGGPTTTKRSAETHVSVRSNQTIVIGGLMQEVETESETKVPILGDIPLIGALFRNKVKSKRKTNLLIFLTPHVIDGAEDLQEVYRIKMLQREEFMRRFYGKSRAEQAAELSSLLRYSMNLPEQPSVYRDRISRPREVDLTSPEGQTNSEELLDLLDAADDNEVLITPDGEYVPVSDDDIVFPEDDEGAGEEQPGDDEGAGEEPDEDGGQ